MDSYLEHSLQQSLDYRVKIGMPVVDLYHDTNYSHCAPDFFSNDYLSITTNKQLHDLLVKSTLSCTRILGSTGSRVLSGNTTDHVELERYLQSHFDAPSALLWNSGYDANVAFFGSVPQKGDFILFDELIHASVRDGITVARASRNAYPFSHNSVAAFEACLTELVEKNPQISERKATVFVAVESLYSMDGDFSPLPELIKVLHRYVPRQCTHIVVDEAHSTGMCGPSGRGYVALLGLQNEVDTVLHTFGKARGSTGAVILTSPVVRKYLINYARPMIYTTSMPRFHLLTIKHAFDFISSADGDALREQLRERSLYLSKKLQRLMKNVPKSVLSFRDSDRSFDTIVSPIFPLLSSKAALLAVYLRSKGYAAQVIPYPAVPKGQERVRVVIHAENTTDDIDAFAETIEEWAVTQSRQILSDMAPGKSTELQRAML